MYREMLKPFHWLSFPLPHAYPQESEQDEGLNASLRKLPGMKIYLLLKKFPLFSLLRFPFFGTFFPPLFLKSTVLLTFEGNQ